MRETIKAGTTLFKEDTILPEGLTFESEQFSPGGRSRVSMNLRSIGERSKRGGRFSTWPENAEPPHSVVKGRKRRAGRSRKSSRA
jgi:hypothetical protein